MASFCLIFFFFRLFAFPLCFNTIKKDFNVQLTPILDLKHNVLYCAPNHLKQKKRRILIDRVTILCTVYICNNFEWGPRKPIDHFMGFVTGILLDEMKMNHAKCQKGMTNKEYLARNSFILQFNVQSAA